ncbi:hypothetical protein HDU98_003116 [Podochytrium sp. JEL0797]|nr:hypothetical protein HDU98_003116 [Podochytrium sp. JEL0797]
MDEEDTTLDTADVQAVLASPSPSKATSTPSINAIDVSLLSRLLEQHLSHFAAHLKQDQEKQNNQTNRHLMMLETKMDSLNQKLGQLEHRVKVAEKANASSAAELVLLEGLAKRLESIGGESVAAPSDLSGFVALADAEESKLGVAPVFSSITAEHLERASQAMEDIQKRLQTVEIVSLKVIPGIVSRQVDELVRKQEAWRRRVETQGQSQDDELLDRLSQLDAKIQTLPELYRGSFLDSLEKQTTSLTELIKEQTETINSAATEGAKKQGYRMSLPPIPAVPHIPDMGITKRFSKLAAALRRPLSSQSFSENNEPKVSSPLTQEPEFGLFSVGFEVLALYNFKAEFEDELEMEAGDVVQVDATTGRNGDMENHNGWWHAVNAEGKEGWVPSNYVQRT